ncbi:DUF465 domain-containing protein [Sphingomonas parapaucimobilis]|jgi:hypothetical protein
MGTDGDFGVLLTPPSNDRRLKPMHTAHQTALETKHATLDRRISAESQRPVPDALILADLKKQKLKLKEEIQGL